MLAKKFRLPIGSIRGRSFRGERGKYFIFKNAKSGLPFSRFGVTVGRGVEKRATWRNWLRRKVFDFVRVRNLHLSPDRDLLIIALPAVSRAPKEEIEVELKRFLGS